MYHLFIQSPFITAHHCRLYTQYRTDRQKKRSCISWRAYELGLDDHHSPCLVYYAQVLAHLPTSAAVCTLYTVLNRPSRMRMGHQNLTLTPLRRGPAHPLSRPHAAALCGWRGARAAAVRSTILKSTYTVGYLLFLSRHAIGSMIQGGLPNVHFASGAGLLEVGCWLLADATVTCTQSHTSRYTHTYTLTTHDFPHATPSCSCSLPCTICKYPSRRSETCTGTDYDLGRSSMGHCPPTQERVLSLTTKTIVHVQPRKIAPSCQDPKHELTVSPLKQSHLLGGLRGTWDRTS